MDAIAERPEDGLTLSEVARLAPRGHARDLPRGAGRPHGPRLAGAAPRAAHLPARPRAGRRRARRGPRAWAWSTWPAPAWNACATTSASAASR
ncbi:hypothetical protein ACU686_19970 [Yinghuangia aomiensis]